MASRSGSAAMAILPSWVTRSVPPEIGGGGVAADTVAGKAGCGPEKPAEPPPDPAVPSNAVGGAGTDATP